MSTVKAMEAWMYDLRILYQALTLTETSTLPFDEREPIWTFKNDVINDKGFMRGCRRMLLNKLSLRFSIE